jgi:hypothetical protein
MKKWVPKSNEDKLLQRYWEERRGHLRVEVPVGSPKGSGHWPTGSKIRRIDGIRFENIPTIDDGIYKFGNRKDFSDLISLNKSVELIEVKNKLDRVVIGQIIAGQDMFEREYESVKISPIIICGEGDPALEWVCDKRRIEVYISSHYT